MKNTKFKMMAIALCLATGFAFAGCNATAEETTKEETTTTTTEATTTTTTEETTTGEETEETEDEDTYYGMPDSATAEDFEVEAVAQLAQDCIDREIAIYPVNAEEFDDTVDPETFIEGFSGMGGSLHVTTDTEEEGASSEGTDFVMVQCAAFTSYEDAVAYADSLIEYASENVDEENIEIQTEETEEGYTFTMSLVEEGVQGTEDIEGYVTTDGVLYYELTIVA